MYLQIAQQNLQHVPSKIEAKYYVIMKIGKKAKL